MAGGYWIVKTKIKSRKRFLRDFSAVRKGLEPSTSGVTGRHSNQLNYRTLRLCIRRFELFS